MADTADAQRPGGMIRLPTEMLVAITAHLSTKDGLALSAACRCLQDILVDFVYYQHIRTSPKPDLPLWWASLHHYGQPLKPGRLNVARRALAQGANPNTYVRVEMASPLFLAARSGDAPLAKLLLQHGANAFATHVGGSALTVSAQHGHLKMVQVLLELVAQSSLGAGHGPDMISGVLSVSHRPACGIMAKYVNARDVGWRTALHHAVLHREVTQLLIRNGADVHLRDAEGATAFLQAARLLSFENLLALHDAGSDLHAVNHDGKNAVEIIISQVVPNTLLEFFMCFDALDKLYGSPPESPALGMDQAQLHRLIVNGTHHQCDALLIMGVPLDLLDAQRVTPLWAIAGTVGNEELLLRVISTARSLCNYAADVDFTSPGTMETPLIRAAHAGNARLVKLLLHCGANCDATDHRGWRP
ncbi:ankyrin repeat-containing domain protein [Microdochium bolleyi]|uniref:Ankyrin repeat-containing domain protein n=1 Tax=Microdochium bolleyi TaxID=196109 RepID=A0A136IZ64_9PEZI|nr:ankyrin repeat-containing domain protein [Microdochium bolleyi]